MNQSSWLPCGASATNAWAERECRGGFFSASGVWNSISTRIFQFPAAKTGRTTCACAITFVPIPEEAAAYAALKMEILDEGVSSLLTYSARKRPWLDDMKARAREWAEAVDSGPKRKSGR